MAVNLNLL